MYKEPEYADSRLRGTIVRLGDEPVFVDNVDGEMICSVSTLEGLAPVRIHVDELNLMSPPLGFVNRNGKAVYISRKPMRQDWRQGVRTNSIITFVGNEPARVDMDNTTIMRCIKGDYPSIGDAVNALEVGEARSAAISREFCLYKHMDNIKVRYSWKGCVGKVEGGKITLLKKWKYLNHLVEKLND